MRRSVRAWGLLVGMALSPSLAQARVLSVGPGQAYAKLGQAAAAAADGDTLRIAAGTYYDCAVLRQDRLTIEGAGADRTVLTDKTCGGKALLVIDGSDVVVRNLTLARARVADGNGAGIRAEGGNLTVDSVHFDNDQDGILSADREDATLSVVNSVFTGNGTCQAACAHAIYAGVFGRLRVHGSTFRNTHEGHHIKSRALQTEVVGCDIADGPDGTASYSIDVPNGGGLRVEGNRIEKGPKAQNHTAISIGEEGVDRPTPAIVVAGNRLRNDGEYTATFVLNVTATPAELRGNTLSGDVKPLNGDGTIDGH